MNLGPEPQPKYHCTPAAQTYCCHTETNIPKSNSGSRQELQRPVTRRSKLSAHSKSNQSRYYRLDGKPSLQRNPSALCIPVSSQPEPNTYGRTKSLNKITSEGERSRRRRQRKHRKHYVEIEADTSSDTKHSITSHCYSSSLSVDVSSEVTAVNRDLDAVLARYERRFDDTIISQISSGLFTCYKYPDYKWDGRMRHQSPASCRNNHRYRSQPEETRWHGGGEAQCCQHSHECTLYSDHTEVSQGKREERPKHGKEQNKEAPSPGVNSKQEYNIDKPPLDTLKYIPVNLLKPRMPASLRKTKQVGTDGTGTVSQTSSANAEMLQSLLSDLISQGYAGEHNLEAGSQPKSVLCNTKNTPVVPTHDISENVKYCTQSKVYAQTMKQNVYTQYSPRIDCSKYTDYKIISPQPDKVNGYTMVPQIELNGNDLAEYKRDTFKFTCCDVQARRDVKETQIDINVRNELEGYQNKSVEHVDFEFHQCKTPAEEQYKESCAEKNIDVDSKTKGELEDNHYTLNGFIMRETNSLFDACEQQRRRHNKKLIHNKLSVDYEKFNNQKTSLMDQFKEKRFSSLPNTSFSSEVVDNDMYRSCPTSSEGFTYTIKDDSSLFEKNDCKGSIDNRSNELRSKDQHQHGQLSFDNDCEIVFPRAKVLPEKMEPEEVYKNDCYQSSSFGSNRTINYPISESEEGKMTSATSFKVRNNPAKRKVIFLPPEDDQKSDVSNKFGANPFHMSYSSERSYIASLIDKALHRAGELPTIPEETIVINQKSELGQVQGFVELDVKDAIELVDRESACHMDAKLCMEITQQLTDTLVDCQKKTDKKKANSYFVVPVEEPIYIKQLKRLRWDHLKHIQREVKRLEDLERFLDSCGSSHSVYSTSGTPVG